MPHNIVAMDVMDHRPNVEIPIEQHGKRVLILVDYSNLLYRAYFSSIKDLEVRPWLPFIRALDMLRSCAKHVKDHKDTQFSFIFCGDSVRKKLDRMKTNESYKEDRPPLTNLKFYIFRNVMNYVIKDLGCEVIFHDGAEGDDVIASLVHKFSKKCDCATPCANCKCADSQRYNSIIIFSCDRDLNSLLEYNNVTIYRPPSIFYTRSDFQTDYGFHPKYFPVYKALVGDKSDNIKGVALWGDNRAKIHIGKLDWLETLEKDGTTDQFNHALSLVTLRTDIPDLPNKGYKIVVGSSGEVFEKIRNEYYRQDAIDDIIFAEKRLE